MSHAGEMQKLNRSTEILRNKEADFKAELMVSSTHSRQEALNLANLNQSSGQKEHK